MRLPESLGLSVELENARLPIFFKYFGNLI